MTTIGIVEDDRLLNEALARMLEKKGYHPLRAYTLEDIFLHYYTEGGNIQ